MVNARQMDNAADVESGNPTAVKLARDRKEGVV